MPVRTFRSSAFSAIAPQRVRFIPYIYVALPVDGPSPVIFNQPQNADNPPSPVVIFYSEAIGEGEITYQWQLKSADAESVWENITDSGVFTGTDTSVLYVNGVTPSDNINQFRVVATNAGGSTTSDSVTLQGDF